jgi:broad specificity phosphatase PhoE
MRPPTQQVLILRHGESEWNVEGRWQGWIDIGLTAAGEEQAARRARQLARDSFRPRAIYASDLRRAAHTAEIIAGTSTSPRSPIPGSVNGTGVSGKATRPTRSM